MSTDGFSSSEIVEMFGRVVLSIPTDLLTLETVNDTPVGCLKSVGISRSGTNIYRHKIGLGSRRSPRPKCARVLAVADIPRKLPRTRAKKQLKSLTLNFFRISECQLLFRHFVLRGFKDRRLIYFAIKPVGILSTPVNVIISFVLTDIYFLIELCTVTDTRSKMSIFGRD